MSRQEPDPRPDEFLFQHNLYLRQLFSALADAAESDPPAQGRLVAQILEALRIHDAIVEDLCFPALLSLRGAPLREAVEGARRTLGAIRQTCEDLASADPGARAAPARRLQAQVERYLEFEELRLLPLLPQLPDVTLREMSLEIQELLAKQGRFH